jgi:hypothetical protein
MGIPFRVANGVNRLEERRDKIHAIEATCSGKVQREAAGQPARGHPRNRGRDVSYR